MPEEIQLITNSRLSSFRQCRRLHYYGYELMRRPRKISEAMGFGTVFHAGLEQWWLAWMERDGREKYALDLAHGGIIAKFAASSEESELDPFDLIKAEELLRGYDLRWSDDMHDLEVLDVEGQFCAPLINPSTGRRSVLFQLGGKLDARVRVISLDRVKVVEHKTSSTDVSPGSNYWRRLMMDSQVSQYVDGARSMGGAAPEGCLYDVAKRPGLRPKAETPEENRKWTLPKACKQHVDEAKARAKAVGEKVLAKEVLIISGCVNCQEARLHKGMRLTPESPDEYRTRVRDSISEDPNSYYQRGEVTRLAAALDEHRFDTWETVKELRLRQLAERKLGEKAWARNPGACDKWGRLCDYWDVCTGAVSIDDDVRFRSATKKHEELDEALLTTGEDDLQVSKEEI